MTDLCSTWVTNDDVTDCDECSGVVDDDLVTDMGLVASQVLFALSGRQFRGTCTTTVRVVVKTRACGLCDSEGLLCGCGGGETVDIITIGAYPIQSVSEVRIDGVALNASAYVVWDRQYLVRTDGDRWPRGTEAVLEVDLTYGESPPRIGEVAAARLTCELVLACQGSDDCQLPKRIQTLAVQGMTATVMDPFDFLQQGQTGIFVVDLFIRAANPAGVQEPAAVIVPELVQHAFEET